MLTPMASPQIIMDASRKTMGSGRVGWGSEASTRLNSRGSHHWAIRRAMYRAFSTSVAKVVLIVIFSFFPRRDEPYNSGFIVVCQEIDKVALLVYIMGTIFCSMKLLDLHKI